MFDKCTSPPRSQLRSVVKQASSSIVQTSPHDYISDLGEDEDIFLYPSPKKSPSPDTIRKKRLVKKHKKHKKHKKSSIRSPDSKSVDGRM